MGAAGIVSNMAKSIISVEIAKVAIKGSAGVNAQNVSVLENSIRRAHDNVVVSALTGTGDQIWCAIGAPLQQVHPHPSADFAF